MPYDRMAPLNRPQAACTHPAARELSTLGAKLPVSIENPEEELLWIAIEAGLHIVRVLVGFVGRVGVIAPLRYVGVSDGEP